MDRGSLLNDPETAMRTALEGWQSGVWTAMPGVVQSVDFSKMTCTVQPAIQGTITDENGNDRNIDYPVLADCPIVFPGGGNFIITLPIAAGDEVLVVFASRCIDSWWQSGGVKNQPMEVRMHDLSDGFVIPGPRSIPAVPGSISTDAIQIRNLDKSAYIEIKADGKIHLVASEVDITGNLVVSGTIGGSGGIGLETHKHSGVTTGAGTSGGPVP